MKRIIFIVILLLSSLTIVKALPLPVEVTADAVVLMNKKTGQIVYEKNPDKEEILASLTKMMTAYLVIENIPDLNEKVTITQQDISNLWGYTIVGLEVGDRVSYLDLIYGTLLRSGADASQALANHMSGSTEEFVKLMNEEAQKLGLRHTHFADCYGGDEGNVSTARELATFVKIALENKTFKDAFEARYYKLTNGKEVVNFTYVYAQFHGLDTSVITGNKSGFTTPAGLLLASTATINNEDYILIVCKSVVNSYYSTHVLDSYRVYNYVEKQNFVKKTLIPKGTILKTVKVVDGTTSEYVVTANKDIVTTITKEDYDKLSFDYNIADSISVNNKPGDNLGYIDILVDGEVIDTYNVYLNDDIYSYQNQSHLMILIIITIGFFIIVLLSINLFNSANSKSKKE